MTTCLILFYYVMLMVLMMADSQLTEVRFDHPVKTIHEDIYTDTVITNVILVGGDIDTVTCNIQQTQPIVAPFDVWLKPGDQEYKVYYTSASGIRLSYSRTPSYILTIVCIERDNAITAQLEVDVLPNKAPDINDYPGKNMVLNASATPSGVNIYSVTVTDPENDVITYSMTTEPPVNYFSLDKNNGVLKTVVDLKTSTESIVSVKVNVSDGKNVVGPFTIRIEMTDLNGRPYFTNLPTTLYIHEDAAAGTTLITLTFNDDIDNTLQPTCSVNPISESFKFDYEKGSRHLRLSNTGTGHSVLDYEGTRLYNITCLVNDGYLGSIDGNIILHVVNVNEAPEFSADIYYCNLYESNAGVSVCEMSISVKDPDGDFFTTDLLHGNNSQRFSLTSVNQNTRMTFNVDYDVDDGTMPRHALLTLGAVDSLGLTGTAKISITIQDVNDNRPEFNTARLDYNIGQKTPPGILGSINATDRDTGHNAQIYYSMKGALPSSTTNYVHVTGNGDVRYTSLFPDSASGSYLLFVEARDNGEPSRSSTGTVAITFTTTTTTTTTTSATTTEITTPVTRSYNFWEHSENVTLFALLMTLLVLGCIIGICLFLFCSCCSSRSTRRRWDCDGCCPRQEVHVRRVQPIYEDYYPSHEPSVASAEYREDFWNKGDHFEDGRPRSTGLVRLQDPRGVVDRTVLARKIY